MLICDRLGKEKVNREEKKGQENWSSHSLPFMIKHGEQCTCLLGHLPLQENICRARTPFSETWAHTGTSREHNSNSRASRYGNIFLSPPSLPQILNKLGIVNTPIAAVFSQISQSSLCFSNLCLPPEEPKEAGACPAAHGHFTDGSAPSEKPVQG